MNSAEKEPFIKVETLIEALVINGIERDSLIKSRTRLCWRYNGFTILLDEFEEGRVNLYTALSISDWLLEMKKGLNDE